MSKAASLNELMRLVGEYNKNPSSVLLNSIVEKTVEVGVLINRAAFFYMEYLRK